MLTFAIAAHAEGVASSLARRVLGDQGDLVATCLLSWHRRSTKGVFLEEQN